MAFLVSEERQHLVGSLLPRREPFQVLYRLNCDNLCSDFQVRRASCSVGGRMSYRCDRVRGCLVELCFTDSCVQ